MQIVTRLIALRRSMQLNRQFREIQRTIDTLPATAQRELSSLLLKELALAGETPLPHLYGTPADELGSEAWGKGADIGFSRVKSDNRHVKLRGIALWLTVAFFETKDSPYGESQSLHRQLMRTLRLLKESAPAPKPEDRWALEADQPQRAVA